MNLIKVGNRFIINVSLVAWAERMSTGDVEVHFPVPLALAQPSAYPGVQPSGGHAGSSDHYSLMFSGTEADEVWKELNAI